MLASQNGETLCYTADPAERPGTIPVNSGCRVEHHLRQAAALRGQRRKGRAVQARHRRPGHTVLCRPRHLLRRPRDPLSSCAPFLALPLLLFQLEVHKRISALNACERQGVLIGQAPSRTCKTAETEDRPGVWDVMLGPVLRRAGQSFVYSCISQDVLWADIQGGPEEGGRSKRLRSEERHEEAGATQNSVSFLLRQECSVSRWRRRT